MANMSSVIKFFGAAGTVTGSKTAIFAGQDLDDRILIDCGLFQGLKQLRLRNWEPPPFDPRSIGSVFITHAHIDHIGYLPRLVRSGFRRSVYCSQATADLMHILLLDSAYLQEEEARFANKYRYSKHKPAKPLYTTEDAEEALGLLRPVALHQPIKIGQHIEATFFEAGHILGSCMIRFNIKKNNSNRTVLFSGDIGRFGVPILPNPEVPEKIDDLIMESTYGDRSHGLNDASSELADVIKRAVERNGILLVPSFAVGRTQLILYMLRELQTSGEIPEIPIYIDSPMAIKALRIYCSNIESMDDETRQMQQSWDHPLRPLKFHTCQSPEESKSLNKIKNRAIIISASGMATGGRILHHLKIRLPQKQNTLLFIGYQANGTRGRTIIEGKDRVKIHGSYIPVRCNIESIGGFSAHADKEELLLWLKKFPTIPDRIFINHGEPTPSEALADSIEKEHGIKPFIPDYLSEYNLFDGIDGY